MAAASMPWRGSVDCRRTLRAKPRCTSATRRNAMLYGCVLCAKESSRRNVPGPGSATRRAKNGRGYLAETLLYAAYVSVPCSPCAGALSTLEALALYRGRRQVELAFKRFKSLLNAGHVPKRQDASARAWMQAKILSALLLERILWDGEFLSPWGYGLERGEFAKPLAAVSRSARRAPTQSQATETSPANACLGANFWLLLG
jgi:hypothetical protein